MKPAPFAYAKARSVAHAIELLANDDARLIAGGQSLIATLNMRLSAPRLLIDLNGIDGLDRIATKNGMIEVGALVRHAQAERSPAIASHAPLIAKALPHIGHPAIRNRGTIGGSIAFADPAAELPACLLALDGEVEITGPHGSRIVQADEFFKGLFETALTPCDVLTAIRVPRADAATRIGFAELARRHGDYAMVGLAACARADEPASGEYPARAPLEGPRWPLASLASAARADGRRLSDVRLAYFGVSATPVRARMAESALAGGDIAAAVAALGRDLNPPDDVQGTGAVKLHLAGVLLRRVAAELMEPRT